MNTIILLIVIIALAVIWAGLGEILGEPSDKFSLVTYPLKVTFNKRWLTWVYRIGWAVLATALCFDVTQLYLQYTDNWGWLLVICPLALLALVITSMIVVMIVLFIGIAITLSFDDLDLK